MRNTKTLALSLGFTLATVPITVKAFPVLAALELVSAVISAIPSPDTPTSSANAGSTARAVGSSTPAVIGTIADSFIGSANAGSAINIDRISDASASARTGFTYIFSNTAYYGNIYFSAVLSGSSSAYSNYSGGGSTSGSGGFSIRFWDSRANKYVDVPVIYANGSSFSSSSACSTSGFFDDCSRSDTFSSTGQINPFFFYPGDRIEISGLLSSSSNGSTGFGSTEHSTYTNSSWSVRVPEPTSFSLLGFGVACLAFFRRGRNGRSKNNLKLRTAGRDVEGALAC